MPDKNFDSLAERFERRIHSSLKGNIRQAVIWRDLTEQIPAINDNTPLRILDVGAGLGHFSLKLAELGHHVTYNDLSIKMMEKAQARVKATNNQHHIEWLNLPYQTLSEQYRDTFDIVLCHAVLEWLEKPEALIPAIKKLVKKEGYLSLCFYNPAGLVYRNLICGNFRYLDELESKQSDSGSLTPQNARDVQQVELWLQAAGFMTKSMSGIRVFSDYVLNKRGGHQSTEEVLLKEIEYSNKEPYKRLGRYNHIVAISAS